MSSLSVVFVSDSHELSHRIYIRISLKQIEQFFYNNNVIIINVNGRCVDKAFIWPKLCCVSVLSIMSSWTSLGKMQLPPQMHRTPVQATAKMFAVPSRMRLFKIQTILCAREMRQAETVCR